MTQMEVIIVVIMKHESYKVLWVFLLLTLLSQAPVGVLEKAMAPHSSTLAWRIPWMEEPGRLQSIGWQRVRHD